MSDKFVLLVEDNADDEALTLRAFRKSSISANVIVVRDGEEALDFIFCTGRYAKRDILNQPDVVVLDLKLPKLDGHQVLEKIRANEATKLLPVIVLTSSREQRDLLESYSKGANSYVVKPVDSKQFLDSIQQLSLYWLLLNESTSSKS